MSAKDLYHDHVRAALLKDGWTITDDPLHLQWGVKDLYVDLGAEKVIGAEKAGRRIAVEVKSFLGPSEIEDLKGALGQYVLYRNVMQKTHVGWELYLAVRETTYLDVFDEPTARLLVEEEGLQLIVFDPQTEVITRWIP
jgi:hypothetical protein